MHNNYYFLRQLSSALQPVLSGTVISECFSQSKDELVIRFETHGEPFFIKASLSPAFSCLSFPKNFNRARKNSVDLFDILIGQRVQHVHQYQNERSFSLVLSNDLTLLFKMHGNRSNVVLFEKENVLLLFKTTMTGDESLTLTTLDRTIDWSYEYFVQQQNALESTYFTLGKPVWKYLHEKNFDSLSLEEKWALFQDTLKRLEQPTYYNTLFHNKLIFSLLAIGEIQKEHHDPIAAIHDYYLSYTHYAAFAQEKNSVLSVLRNKLQGSESYYQKTFAKLVEVESDTNYKTWADLIMAHMHTIKLGMGTVVLPDFYQENHMVEIKLKKDLSPQKNAESYYRKAKNQHIEIQRLQQALEGKEKEIASLKNEIASLDSVTALKTLRTQIEANPLFQAKEKQAAPLPYHEFEFHGYKIWVGKNAQANDLLTFKFGYKEDLWLHAKDVPGSHVLIKHQSGKNFPRDVIERAAELAAYNSKRKTETLCPVAVTPRKFVRKRKGDPAGSVVVEKEEVVMVAPRLE